MSIRNAARSKDATHSALPWTVLGLLVALGLGLWRSELEPAGSSTQPLVAGTSKTFEALGAASLPAAAGDRVGYGEGSRTYPFAIEVLDPVDRSARLLADSWNGQLRRSGPQGEVESITSMAPRLHGAPGVRFEWVELEVHGQLAKPIRSEFRLGDEAFVTAEAELLVDGAVRAVDAATGNDLPRVSVVLAQGAEGQFLLPPVERASHDSIQRVSSPVPMPAARGRATYWLGAPGYAWRRITYSGAEGGTPVHALEPGGSLSLRRLGAAGRDASVFVSLIRPAHEGAAEQGIGKTELAEGSDVTFDGLPSGEVTARFSVLAGDIPEFVVHKETVQLETGAHRTVELDLARHWTPAGYASLAMRLDAMTETDLTGYEISLTRLGPESSVPLRKPVTLLRKGDFGQRLWSADALLPGRYQLTVTPNGCFTDFELTEGEAKTLELALAPAPVLRVWCLDASNGTPVQPNLIVWRRSTSDAWSSTQFRWAEEACVLRMDPGVFEFGVSAQGFMTALSRIDVQTGVNEAVVELSPTQSIELQVTLWCDGAEMPISADEWSRARLRDPAGRDAVVSVNVGTGTGDAACCRETATARILVGAPGEYDLQLELPPQFRGPVQRKVLVEPSGSRLSIELERIASMAQR